MIEINESAIWPKCLAKFFARNDFSSLFKERDEKDKTAGPEALP